MGKYVGSFCFQEDRILLLHAREHGTKKWGILGASGKLPKRDNKACCNRFLLLKRRFVEERPSIQVSPSRRNVPVVAQTRYGLINFGKFTLKECDDLFLEHTSHEGTQGEPVSGEGLSGEGSPGGGTSDPRLRSSIQPPKFSRAARPGGEVEPQALVGKAGSATQPGLPGRATKPQQRREDQPPDRHRGDKAVAQLLLGQIEGSPGQVAALARPAGLLLKPEAEADIFPALPTRAGPTHALGSQHSWGSAQLGFSTGTDRAAALQGTSAPLLDTQGRGASGFHQVQWRSLSDSAMGSGPSTYLPQATARGLVGVRDTPGSGGGTGSMRIPDSAGGSFLWQPEEASLGYPAPGWAGPSPGGARSLMMEAGQGLGSGAESFVPDTTGGFGGLAATVEGRQMETSLGQMGTLLDTQELGQVLPALGSLTSASHTGQYVSSALPGAAHWGLNALAEFGFSDATGLPGSLPEGEDPWGSSVLGGLPNQPSLIGTGQQQAQAAFMRPGLQLRGAAGAVQGLGVGAREALGSRTSAFTTPTPLNFPPLLPPLAEQQGLALPQDTRLHAPLPDTTKLPLDFADTSPQAVPQVQGSFSPSLGGRSFSLASHPGRPAQVIGPGIDQAQFTGSLRSRGFQGSQTDSTAYTVKHSSATDGSREWGSQVSPGLLYTVQGSPLNPDFGAWTQPDPQNLLSWGHVGEGSREMTNSGVAVRSSVLGVGLAGPKRKREGGVTPVAVLGVSEASTKDRCRSLSPPACPSPLLFNSAGRVGMSEPGLLGSALGATGVTDTGFTGAELGRGALGGIFPGAQGVALGRRWQVKDVTAGNALPLGNSGLVQARSDQGMPRASTFATDMGGEQGVSVSQQVLPYQAGSLLEHMQEKIQGDGHTSWIPKPE